MSKQSIKGAIPDEEKMISIIEDKAYNMMDQKDLQPLFNMIGDSQLVLLGEASHGTHEYYTIRSYITQQLIKQKGFQFIGVEGDWPDCYQLNRYVKNYADAGKTSFDVLKQWSREDKRYDVVMLDPPAFTKSRATIQKAITGYKEINLRGMKLVKPGGFLVTSSCTNLVQPDLFLQIIDMAARDARRKIRQVTFQAQSSDHPISWNMENTH